MRSPLCNQATVVKITWLIFGFVGPAIGFVCAETIVVGLWTTQLTRLGFPAMGGAPRLAHRSASRIPSPDYSRVQ